MTDICRLCASLKTLDHLVTMTDPQLDIKRKLLRCCQLELREDDDFLPQNVCTVCIQSLENSWTFAENVSEAQKTLRKAFSDDFAQKLIKCEADVIKVENGGKFNDILYCWKVKLNFNVPLFHFRS